MLLELRHLKKYYGAHKAVDDISFTVDQGSIFGLLGPNGAGKTTLLRMITGIFLPDEGQVLLNGQPFDPMRDIALIGYMPEERGLYKKMKIGEQALYLAQLKGLGKARATELVKEWFVRLEMQSWWNKKVEDLSKGMQQKLQFVTTVVHQPKLIILDEPFSGLDPVNSNIIKEEIFRLAKEGATIIFSTHRMEQVEEICDHIVLVNRGTKILDGTVRNVRQQFKEHLFKVGFGKPVNLADGRSFQLVESRQAGTEAIVRISEGSDPNAVLTELMAGGASIHFFQELLPSLNEIFIRLVEGSSAARPFQNAAKNIV
jgi:ABC-2 type transport system ATP-binding protein